MRSFWKKGLSALLLALVCVGLCGCRQTNASNGIQAAEDAYEADWQKQYKAVINESSGELCGVAKAGDKLLLFRKLGKEYLFSVLTVESIWSESDVLQPADVALGWAGNYDHLYFFSDGREQLYAIGTKSEGNVIRHSLCCFDIEGSLCRENDITEQWQDAFGAEWATTAATADWDGKVYIGAASEREIMVLDQDGNIDHRINLKEKDTKPYSMSQAEGNLYLVCDGKLYCEADNGKADLLMDVPEDEGNPGLCTASSDSLFYGGYDGIYECNLSEKSWHKLFDWNSGGLAMQDVYAFETDGLGRICIVKTQADRNADVLALLQKEDKSEETGMQQAGPGKKTEKITLLLAGDDRDEALMKAVGMFNVTDDLYQIEVRSYEEERLRAELAAGKGPDLFAPQLFGIGECEKKGLVEDLNSYLANSRNLKRDMLCEQVLEAYTINGILECIPPSFCIGTVFGRAADLGEEPGWTIEEFLEYVEENRGLSVMEGVMQGDSRMILMLTLWQANQNRWVDWENQKACFDSPEFRTALSYALQYESAHDNETGDKTDKWREGRLLLYTYVVNDMRAYLHHMNVLDEREVAIGYPTLEGAPCHEISAYGGYSINSKSHEKEGAWRFIEFLVLGQKGGEVYQNGIPTLNRAREEMIESERVREQNIIWSGITLLPAGEEEINGFQQLIENAVLQDKNGFGTIRQILETELRACFDGRQSMEKTIEVLQSRVQLYLDEQ